MTLKKLLLSLFFFLALTSCSAKNFPVSNSSNELDPSNQQKSELLTTNGLTQVKEGNLVKALEYFTTAIALNPQNEDALSNRGNVYRYLEDYENALADFHQALTVNPEFYQAYYNRATVYLFKKNYDKSLENLEKALSINPNFPMAYYLQGLVFLEQKQPSQALPYFTQAIEINSTLSLAYYYRGLTYSYLGDLEKALVDINRSVSLFAQNGQFIQANQALVFKGVIEQQLSSKVQQISLESLPNLVTEL